jgi:UTP-glucose-1-phosphate uridylyltransferase
MENIQLIIPMSGIGKRFIDSGYEDPKPLILVDDKPIIVFTIAISKNNKAK